MRSGYEQRVLDDLTERGYDYEYEPIKISWSERLRNGRCTQCGGQEVEQLRTYTPDVRIGKRLVEIKGRFTGRNRTVLLGVRRTGAEAVNHILFQRDNPFGKRRTLYSEWATARGFVWAVGEEIPEAWLN